MNAIISLNTLESIDKSGSCNVYTDRYIEDKGCS